MSKRSRSQRIGGLALATALGAVTLLGSAGSTGLAQEATPQVGSAEDLASPNWTWPVQWVVNDEKQPAMYEPIDPASITKPWNICVSFPHLKDPYWLGADYGIAEEIRRDGASMQLFEAGGYTELDKQLSARGPGNHPGRNQRRGCQRQGRGDRRQRHPGHRLRQRRQLPQGFRARPGQLLRHGVHNRDLYERESGQWG
jgi:hypothetical protein